MVSLCILSKTYFIQHGSHGRGILFIVELPLILQTVGIHTITDQIAQDTVTAAAEVCQKIEIISKFLREILPQESFPVLLRQQGEGKQKKQATSIPTTQHILDNYDTLTIAEKNRLW